ncbi:MAG: tyrosine-type recombinase/integrase [Sulfurimonas sp.]|jgi:integrase/recombinase XerC|nr:tyrosine-type recombinase/integrase [Sulfurimonadaceae bacterium]
MMIEARVGEFLEYLKDIRGYSSLTIKSYKESLDEAFLYIEIEKKDSFYILNLMPYRVNIAHLNPKTISKKLSAIRSFATFLNDNGIKTTLKSDDTIKVAKTLPKPISHKHILEAIDTATLEDRLLVVLLYTLGLRISELSELKLEDIGDEWVRVFGKGSKTRDVPLLKSTKKLLDEYLELNPRKNYIFEKNGKKLSQNSLRYNIDKIFKRVGLKVTPHQLRHSYASQLLNQNAPISDVSELLGHSSIATTQIYTKLGSAIKQQNYAKAHPLASRK